MEMGLINVSMFKMYKLSYKKCHPLYFIVGFSLKRNQGKGKKKENFFSQISKKKIDKRHLYLHRFY
jgi:hypothetical protein